MNSKKWKKLFKNPDLFFYDLFAKRLNRQSVSSKSENIDLCENIDKNKTIFENILDRFDLNTGALTSFKDQSLLLEKNQLISFISYIFQLSSYFKYDLKFYNELKDYKEIKFGETIFQNNLYQVFELFKNRKSFVIEFDSYFSIEVFIYELVEDDFLVVKSDVSYIKKLKQEQFDLVYPKAEIKDNVYQFTTPFKIDAVYTWVDKNDESWQEMWNSTFPDNPIDLDRFASKDELKYSLRSIEKFAPWINHIYVVTNCKKPEWLKDNPKLTWIDHKDIFPKADMLPTFNSHSIESCLHRIEELSEHFIYFNDDVFLNQPCYYNDFFDETGRSVAVFEPYGMVFEDKMIDESLSYLIASLNSYKLLKDEFKGYKATRLHQHVPLSLRKSVIEEMEEKFEQEFEATRYAKLRSESDINVPSFLYQHYAIASGKAIEKEHKAFLVRPRNIERLLRNNNFLEHKYLCFNDGDGSANDIDYKKLFIKFCSIRLK